MSLLAESSLSQDVRFHAFSHDSPTLGPSSPYSGYVNYTPKSGKSPKKSPSPYKSHGHRSSNNASPVSTPMKSTINEYAYEYGYVNGYYYYFDGVTFYGVPAPSDDQKELNISQTTNSPDKAPLSSEPTAPVPLENSWCFWFDKYLGPGLSITEYEAAMKNYGTFSTVQEFWRYYNNLPLASKLPPRTSYHMMKAGVKPLWEDPENMNGGSFSFRISKDISDDSWLHILLGVIGEQFDEILNPDDDICGVSISRRRDENVINIWHKCSASIDKEKFSNFLVKILSRVSDFVPTVNYKVHKCEENFKTQSSPSST